MSTTVSEITTRETTHMITRLFDVDAGASGVDIARSARFSQKAVRMLVAGLVAIVLAAVFVSSAFAAPGRAYESSFGAFTSPQALTVDQSTGDVYVVDPGAGTVSRFDAGGAVENFTCGACSGNTLTGFVFDGPSAAQVAVAPAGAPGGTAGDIYVVSFAGVSIFANDGTALGSITQANGAGFGEACGVATDPAGRLYVGDYGGAVDRYVPTANPATDGDYDAQITGVSSPCNVAADSTGAVYASTYSTGPLTKYLASDFGTANPGVQIDAVSTAVAVDPVTDEVYVDEGNQVHVFDASGVSEYTFGASTDFGADSAGVAVRSAGKAYVADRTSGQIDVFGVFSDPPIAVSDPATTIHHTDAILNGHLSPGGDPSITDCHFEYLTDAAFQANPSADRFAGASTIACDQGNTFTTGAEVTALANNLTPGTTYHFRLHITGSTSGVVAGAEQSFTPPPFPIASTQLAAFGPDGTPGSSFSQFNPRGLGFDQANRRVYASDNGINGIYGFDASAPPAFPPLPGFSPLPIFATFGQEGVAVDNSTGASAGNIYFSTTATTAGDNSTGKVFGFDSTGAALGGNFPVDPVVSPGAPAGSPKFVCGDAVDSAGNLWVANGFATNRLLRYDSAGVFQSSLDVSAQFPSPFYGPCRVAFDSSDNLYVAEYQGAVWRFTAASGYTASTQIQGASDLARAIVVDPLTDDLYVANTAGAASVKLYNAAGTLQGTFATGIDGADFEGIAVDPANHDVYVADTTNRKIRVFSLAFQKPPTITPGAPTAISGDSATLNAKVDPENFAVTDCHFDYGTDDSYGHTAPCVPGAASIGSGSGDVSVHADIAGLNGGNTYHFRFVASNAEVGGTASGPDQSLITLGPDISATKATDISDTAATLRAQVNPRGRSTTYRFEYGTDTSYGHSAPAAPAAIGSGSSAVAVAEHITGLQPATTYHFRLVATSSDGTNHGPDTTFTTHPAPAPIDTNCPNQALRTGPGATLPDCRAYEQVSPKDKKGASVTGRYNFNQAAADGHAVVFGSYADLPSTGGHAGTTPAYVASRGPSGWSSDSTTPDSGPGGDGIDIGRDDNLRASLSRIQVQGTTSLFRTDLNTFDRQSVLAGVGSPGNDAQFADDTDHFIFEDTKAVVPGAVDGPQNLYDLDHGDVTLAGRVPVFPATSCTDGGAPADDCTAPAGGSFAGSYRLSPATPGVPPGDLTSGNGYKQDTISDDGSRVFFTEGATGRLYERHNGTSTVQISAPQGVTDPNGHKPAAFMAATPDGRTVYFVSCEKLTADSTAVSTGDNNCLMSSQGQDLYAYDTGSDALTDLTPDTHGSDAQGAQVKGVLGVSPDGAYVYFTANGVLAPGATPGDCGNNQSARGELSGSCSLYLSHGGDISFVARLGGAGLPQPDYSNWLPGPSIIATAAIAKTARVAASGILLFSSTRSLTGYANTGPTCNADGSSSPGLCPELYRFDPHANEGDGRVGCVSCNPTGAPPIDAAGLDSDAGSPLFRVPPLGILTRVLSADGNRVFFETPDQLVPADTNGDDGCPVSFIGNYEPVRACQDVYEWEADGTGSCHSSAQNGGCLSLLSTGTSTAPSRLDDASASGDDVFIYTGSRLVAQDHDDLTDLYDVRVDGGLPSQQQVSSPPCTGDVCQGAPSAPLILSVAGSVAFTGLGNAPSRPGLSVTPKPKVSSKTVRGSSGVLSVKVPSRGRVTVSGTGLRRASAAAGKAGTYKLKVVLSAKAQRALKKAHVLRVKAKVVFAPSSGAPATATIALTFRTVTTTKKGR